MATFSIRAQIKAGTGMSIAGADEATSVERRLPIVVGLWASVLALGLSIVYVGAFIALLFGGLAMPPPEPSQTIFGVVTLLSAPVLVALMAAVHYITSPERKILTHLALAFMLGCAVLTCINRYVQLTVVRQSIAAGKESEVAHFLPYSPDSVMLSIESLAWGLFLGLALLFAAPAFFEGGGPERVREGVGLAAWIRWLLAGTGALSLLYAFAFVMQWGWLSYSGPLAWVAGLTAVEALLVVYFSHLRKMT